MSEKIDFGLIEVEKRSELQTTLRNHKGTPYYIREMFSNYVSAVGKLIRDLMKGSVKIEKIKDLEKEVLKTVKAHVPKEILDCNDDDLYVDPECLIYDIKNKFKAFLEGLNDG